MMKVNHIKQLFVALFLLLSAGTATAAQWKLAKTNLNAAGSKDTLTLKVSDNTVDFSSFQVDFTLPAGVLLSGTPILGELADDHALTWSKRTDGMFAYAMIVGVNNGWLNKEEYAPVARRAWLGLCNYINDKNDLTEVCVGTGKKNSKQYYMDRPRIAGDYHGQAPIIWCAYALLNK